MSEKRITTGWQVCNETARDISKAVKRELKKFGHLDTFFVALLRDWAKDDASFHKISEDGFRNGAGKGAKLKAR